MRIVLLADSHGDARACLRAIDAMEPDAVFFLGDIMRDAQHIRAARPALTLYEVVGNNDFASTVPTERVETMDGQRVFLTHGHLYRVSYDPARLARAAKERGCSIAFFGHTHIPFHEVVDGVHLFNPGSVRLPRRGEPCFGVWETDAPHNAALMHVDWIL